MSEGGPLRHLDQDGAEESEEDFRSYAVGEPG